MPSNLLSPSSNEMPLQRFLANDLESSDAAFVAAMRKLGATTAAAALAHRDLPPLARERFTVLVDLGVLREGAPGTFYLFERSAGVRAESDVAGSAFRRFAGLRAVFWLAVLLLPILLIQLLA
jgi:hypothetical protein